MARDTTLYYLRHHVLDAARVLELAQPGELAAFIDGLDRDDQVLLLTNLLPETAAAYLAQVEPETAADVVEGLRSSIAARILGVLPQASRRRVMEALPIEKQTNIRHLLRYPDDSVGSLMLSDTLACRVDATVRRAKRLVRRLSQTELPMMVVVDDLMKPVGVISVSTLMRVREREFVKDHMRFVPSRLRAHADIRTVLAMPVWDTEDYLPVVDSDDRYIGLLPKSRLHRHALAVPAAAMDTDDVSTTILNLADMLWSPAAEVLARVTTVKEVENHNE